ncbi:MAG: peptidoglycan-binding protein [Bacteroidota bacterium]
MKSTKQFLLLLTLMGLVFAGMAQTEEEIPFEDLPPTPAYGKCYAKCKMPDRYEWVEKKKLIKEASSRYEIVPAVYRNVEERVLVKEASTKQIPVAAVYENASERVMVKEASSRVEEIPAVYRSESNQELVEKARGEWVRKKDDKNCFSDNPEDCYILCWEEKPAVYRTVSKQVLVTPAKTRSVEIPAEYKTLTKRVLKTPATVRTVQIPAEYKTITKRVLVTPAQKKEINIPAQYETYNEKVLIAKGGYTEWTEILCAAQTTTYTVQRVQRALLAKGYNPGPIDGVLGVKTQTALRQYQSDNTLPIGNLNYETLQALGIQI